MDNIVLFRNVVHLKTPHLQMILLSPIPLPEYDTIIKYHCAKYYMLWLRLKDIVTKGPCKLPIYKCI